VDIGPFYDLSAEVIRVNGYMIKQAAAASGAKILVPGRVVILRDGVSSFTFHHAYKEGIWLISSTSLATSLSS
jgi:hypothetical protein